MRSAQVRLGGLCVLLCAVATGLLVVVPGVTGPAPWYQVAALVAGFVAAEASQLHFSFRKQTASVSLSELPLVTGLLVAGPEQVVLARLAAVAVVFAVRRTPWTKSWFNLSLFAAETAWMSALLHWFGTGNPPDPLDWPAIYAAAVAALCASTLAVVVGMRILGSTVRARAAARTLLAAALPTVLNTTLALLAILVVRAEPAAWLLLAVAAAVFIAGYRSYAGLLNRHASLNQLYDLSSELARTLSYPALLETLLDRCRDLLRAERVRLRVPGEDGPDPVLASVVSSQRSAVMSRRTRRRAEREWLRTHGLRDAVLVPLSDGDAMVGVLQAEDRLGEMTTFVAEDAQLLQTIATHAETALRGVRLMDRLRHDAEHDTLTGLGNRLMLVRRMEELLADGRSGALLLADLSRFKDVNDSFGHGVGDLLLAEAATRVAALTGPAGTAARLGGDEFALLVPDCVGHDAAVAVAQTLRAALGQAFEVANTTFDMAAAVGVALLPEHGQDATSGLQHVDAARNLAKDAPTGIAVYNSAADAENLTRLALSRDLRRGIEDGELVVHYQPKVRLDTGELAGVEALVRWQHPERGRVMPDVFIPLAEQTGLIGALTGQVLRASLEQVRDWLDSGSRIAVAVNLSARGLLDPELVPTVAAELARAGVDPGLLTLEITESCVMDDFAASVAVLHALNGLGVSLSLDDFGTGYSSLAYLQRLPVRELKIDKSFVFRMREEAVTASIVRTIVDLAHTLGLQVVAEGVEDTETRQLLADIGCDCIQGYLLARPLAVTDLGSWLASQTRRIPEQPGGPGEPRPVRRLRVVV